MKTGAAVQNRSEIPGLCSGYGQWHSPNNNHNPRDYLAISMEAIRAMLPDPPSVEKSQAQWAIFSTLPSRVHAEQREQGQFHALWADIDDTAGMTIAEIVDRCNGFLLDFWVYTSSSATLKNPKFRIIVPLVEPVDGHRFIILQKILNDKLQENGITPDRATERAGQVCYLPNLGEYYRYHIEESVGPMHPDAWAAEIQAEQARLDAAEKASKQRHEQARAKATQRMQSGCKSPIDAYNAEFGLEMVLESYGYTRRGSRWLSPNSGSGTPGVTISSDGRKWISTHGSDAAIGQATTNGTMGDAFDLFTFYEHGGDRDAAIKAAARMFSIEKPLNPRNGGAPEPPPDWSYNYQEGLNCLDYKKPTTDAPPPERETPPCEDAGSCLLDTFTMNGLAGEMEKQMLDDKFVLDRMAILGQSTAFYAKPSAGKTLLTIWLLIEAIKGGEIDGTDVFYINADDNHKGLVYKLKLAEKYGFKMLAPGYLKFKSDQLPMILEQMVTAGTVKKKVLVLDTVKKFTDLMSKTKSSAFSETVRKFVSHGGSVIMLAHVNKHRDGDNKVIYSGTADLVDDADCAYTLDIVLDDPETGMRTVKFENFKARGDVAHETFYQYDYRDGTPYYGRLESVTQIGEAERKEAEKCKRLEKTLERNRSAIDAISECLREGINQKTALIAEARERSGLSKRQIIKALGDHTGKKADENQFWNFTLKGTNGHVYALNYGVLSAVGGGGVEN
jgi:hypothetical protein